MEVRARRASGLQVHNNNTRHHHIDNLSLKVYMVEISFPCIELPMVGAQLEPEGWVGQDVISAKVRLALSMPSPSMP